MERIRVSVFASNRQQLVYTQTLYAFESENAGIEPLKLQEICELDDEQFDDEKSASDDKPSDLHFNHEWIHQKVKFCVLFFFSRKKRLKFSSYNTIFCVIFLV